MARSTVRITFNERQIDSMLLPITGGAAHHAAEVTKLRIQRNIVATGRIKTGYMLRTITVKQVRRTSRLCEMAVGSPAHYTKFQEYGTRFITPAHFIRDAINSLTFRDFFPNATGH